MNANTKEALKKFAEAVKDMVRGFDPHIIESEPVIKAADHLIRKLDADETII